MRPIKFRAWDKEEKRMWHDVQDAYDTLNHHCDCDEDDLDCDCCFSPRSFGEALEDDDLTIMQYTGLKDKNGKEIYEGDIVKDYNLGIICDVDLDIIRGNPQDYEVIDNIYENPTLLDTLSPPQ